MRVLDSVVMANRATARAAAPSGHGVVCSAGFTGWLQRVQGAAVLPTVLRQSACSTRSTTLCASMARRTAEHGPHAQAQHVAVPDPAPSGLDCQAADSQAARHSQTTTPRQFCVSVTLWFFGYQATPHHAFFKAGHALFMQNSAKTVKVWSLVLILCAGKNKMNLGFF